MTKLVESLIARYKVAEHPAWGKVVVVPIDRFEPEWDEQLLDEGSEAHGQGDFIYVKVPKGIEIPQRAQTKTEPRQKKPSKQKKDAKKTGRGPRWTTEQDELLIKIANAPKVKRDEVPAKYNEATKDKKGWPKRSEFSIKNRVGRLRNRGKVKRRIGLTKQYWTPKEDKLIIDIAKDETLTIDDICTKYLEKKKKKWPRRTNDAVSKRITMLRQMGKIPYKRHPSRETGAPTEEATDEEATPPAEGPAESPVKPVSLEKLAEGVKKDEGFSAIVFDEEQLLMQLRRKDVEKWGPVLKAALGDSS